MKKEQPKTPKTGLASAIREWASRRRKPFSPVEICDGMGVPPGKERDKVRNAIPDFLARGEMERAGAGRYRYNRGWRCTRKAAPIKMRLIKAIYVSGPAFTVADIMRWAEAPSRNHAQKLVRRLRDAGYVRRAGLRKVRQGRESVYQVMDRERFRKDLM